MNLPLQISAIDLEKVEKKTIHAIESYVKRAGYPGVVLGLSGGIDSSLTASLCAKALGGENVLGLSLPDKTTSKTDISLAKRIARHFGLGFDIVDITPVTTRISETLPVYDPLDLVSAGNVKARVRMLILYYYANRQGRLVVGTSDRSELMIGYFTKYGDAGADLLPLSGLYKTQVLQFARSVGIPKEIVERKPSPGLWAGQTAESELGLTYQTIDLVLHGIEQGLVPVEISRLTQVPIRTVEYVLNRVITTEHKRRGPVYLSAERGIRILGHTIRI